MAGDWIKVEKCTARKPEVLRMADLLSIHPDHAFGLCVRFWSWADDQMEIGHAPSVTTVTLDVVFGHAGFASALLEVGWLLVRNGSLEVPNFDRHLSESAKKRALSGERQRKARKNTVTQTSRCERDKSVTREEKRREEKNKDKEPPNPLPGGIAPEEKPRRSRSADPFADVRIPDSLASPEFVTAWGKWVAHRREKRPPVTATAAQSQMDLLAEWGLERAIAALKHSTAGGWQGIFEPERKRNQHQQPQLSALAEWAQEASE